VNAALVGRLNTMERALHGIDLAAEMAAARQRRMEQTARALREARVIAVRAAARPGATREDVEDMARSFYPRLNAEQIEEVTTLVWGSPRVYDTLREADVEDEVEGVEEIDVAVLDEEPVAEI
jgi:hypothetical protein